MESDTKIIRKRNPRETTNPISAVLFLHMIPVFTNNWKKCMEKDDLYEALDEHKSNTLGSKLEMLWRKEYEKHKETALHRALAKLVMFELIIAGILKFIDEMIFIAVAPYSIGNLVEYFSSSNSKVDKDQAYLHASILIISLVVATLVSHPTMMLMMHICMKMRVACCSLIYRKSLRLSSSALGKTTIGQIVNLLTNDVSKFDQGFVLVHYIWIAPIQTIVGTYLLYQAIGVSAFSGIGFLLLFIPIQILLGKQTSVLRLKTALRTDERVRLMNEILNGIQVIKMYTWEKPFAKLISFIRRYEIKFIRYHFFLNAVMFSLEMFITRTALFISIMVYIALGNNLTAEKVYIITAIYNVLKPVITFLFSISISSIAEVNISICRLQKLMTYEELESSQNCTTIFNPIILENETKMKQYYEQQQFMSPKICFKDANAKWQDDATENTLSNINLTIENNQLVAVIGSVGSGKSSLFNVILKELPLRDGILEVNGKISYAAQEAWLFSASVRQNILFGDEYDESRYKSVIKVCALETDLDMLPYGDRTLVGEKGKALSGGQKARINLARCIYKRANIYLLDDPLSAVDTKVGKQLYEECIKKFLSGKLCVLITHQLQYIKNADRIVILDDGKIIGNGSYDSLQSSSSNFAVLLRNYNTGEVNEDVKKKIRSRQNSEIAEQTYEDNEDESADKFEETAELGHIKAKTYAEYFRAGGNFFLLFGLLLIFILNQGVGNGGDYYVAYWVNLEQDLNERNQSGAPTEDLDRNPIIYTYSAIIAATIILSLSHAVFYFMFFMRASINLHNTIFEKILGAVMTFFNGNPTGRILNRFSRDMGIVDEYIPFVLIDCVEIALTLIGVIILSGIVNPWLLIPSFIMIICFYLLRVVCLETSRTVKRIEGITRSPMFSHITASMHGLSTIRAFSAEKTLIKEFDNHQDLHSSAWHLFISASRAFGFWLDLICTLFISLIIISLLVLNRDYYGGEVGLIITQYLGLMGMLQWGMRQWAELENNMTSVERLLEYTRVETEPTRNSITTIPKNWPEYGRIEFRNVSMKYISDEDPVLKNLNFTINSCEKIGIVGRTGAGKTSTIAALFQLYNIDGSIIIDDIDTTKMPLDELRPKISIIPQEPMLFSGSMRKNLDPFEEFNDEVIWNALDQVELKDVIAEMPQGLNYTVCESGANFSIGQRQLICLARAIIRSNKILVMDEATANVDPHTDGLIQKSIRKNFDNCTVITIAHRLHTIMDSDRVLVVDAGNIVEFDHPYTLLQKSNSIFYSMVQTTGANASKNLLSIAEENFEQRKNT